MHRFLPTVRRSREPSSLLVQFALVLMLWSGPVPVLHNHGALAASLSDSARLTEHLVRFHSSGCCASSECAGWHLHWVLPGEETSSLSGSSRLGCDRSVSPIARDGSSTLDLGLDLLQPVLNVKVSNLAFTRAPSEVQTGLPNFFCAYARALSMPERMGVLRC